MDSFKQELCLRPDYCSLDHFRLIDIGARGAIRSAELLSFLTSLDPTFTISRVNDVFRRVDTDGDGLVSYSDFLNLIVPLNPEFEATLNTRNPRNSNNDYVLVELFSLTTR